MPLNFKEDGTTPPPAQGPVLHQPGDGKKGISKILIVLFVIVVVGAAAYLVYEYSLLRTGNAPDMTVAEKAPEILHREAPQQQSPDTARMPADSGMLGREQRDVDTSLNHNTEEMPVPSRVGNYTIYISRHKTKEVADVEAGKWQEAGYETTVTEYDGWYRVSIGSFTTWDEAKVVAEKLKDGLEAGYRIGKIGD